MKQFSSFIKKSALFVIGFLIVVFLLDAVIKLSISKITVGEYGVFNKINDGKINSDIIISGSSRAFKAINPEVITNETGLSCYNIAADGSDLGIQVAKLKWYLNHNRKPKIIIQDLTQFGGSISNTIYEPFKYLPYLNDDSLYQGLLKIDKDIWQNKYLIPTNLIYYNFDFYAELASEIIATINGKDNLVNGFLPDNSIWSGDFEEYKKNNPKGIDCYISEKFNEYILKLIQLCREKEIILVLTVLPNYYKLQEVTNNADTVFTYYNSLENEPNIYYLDYSNSELAKTKKYLYNFTHLNLTGAHLFSRTISKEILNIKHNLN